MSCSNELQLKVAFPLLAFKEKEDEPVANFGYLPK